MAPPIKTPTPAPKSLKPSQKAYLGSLRKHAPSRCEICDKPLPTFEDREKHVAETKHCECDECGRYIPPGYVYSHWCVMHDDLSWNDHFIATGDVITLKEALPWVREEYQKVRPDVDVGQWLGLKSESEVTEGPGSGDGEPEGGEQGDGR